MFKGHLKGLYTLALANTGERFGLLYHAGHLRALSANQVRLHAGMPLWMVWGVPVALCLHSAVFIFSIMKRLECATQGC